MEEIILWSRIVHQFRESCLNFDRLWIKRKRSFSTESMVKSLMLLTAGSRQAYCRTLEQIWPDSTPAPAASSFCEARTKFPPHIIGEIRRDLLELSDESTKSDIWHGFRLHAVDGTKVSLPRSLFAYGFRAAPGGFCPQALVSLLVRLDDRMAIDIRLSKHENERAEAHEHLAHLHRGDLVIYDRGYLSFSLLQAHQSHKVAAVFRVSKGVTFKPIELFWKSKKTEAVVTIDPTSVTYRNSKKKHPEYQPGPIKVRLIKYQISGQTYVLATTLLNEDIPAEDFVPLYAERWKAEETFKAYKQTLEMEVFHSKTENGILQEIESTALFWNLSRTITNSIDDKLKKNETAAQYYRTSKLTAAKVS